MMMRSMSSAQKLNLEDVDADMGKGFVAKSFFNFVADKSRNMIFEDDEGSHLYFCMLFGSQFGLETGCR